MLFYATFIYVEKIGVLLDGTKDWYDYMHVLWVVIISWELGHSVEIGRDWIDLMQWSFAIMLLMKHFALN